MQTKWQDTWKDDGAGHFCIYSYKPCPLSVGNVCFLTYLDYKKHISLAEVEYISVHQKWYMCVDEFLMLPKDNINIKLKGLFCVV